MTKILIKLLPQYCNALEDRPCFQLCKKGSACDMNFKLTKRSYGEGGRYSHGWKCPKVGEKTVASSHSQDPPQNKILAQLLR